MSAPARLYKKQPEPKVLVWVNSHAYIIVPVCIVILFLLITALLYVVIGGCAVESGMLRNFLNGGV